MIYFMAKTLFFFYDVEPQIKERKSFDFLEKFKEIQKEKQENNIQYFEIDSHRVCVVINEKDIIEDDDEAHILGKFIASEDIAGFREESRGDFYDIELSEEDSKICYIEKGALFFLMYINKKDDKNVLMFESVNFSIGIGGFRTYFQRKYLNDIEGIITKQKLGRDLKSELQRVSRNGLKLARIRVNRDITLEQLKDRGVIEKAAPLLLDKDIDCELVFRFRKGEKTFSSFLRDIFHKEDITDLMQTEFGDVFRTFSFLLDNTATPKFNFFDKVFRYELPFTKKEHIDEEKDIFEDMIDYFRKNKDYILAQE